MKSKKSKGIRNERYDAPEHFLYPYVPNRGHMLILQPQTSEKMSKLRFFVPPVLACFGGTFWGSKFQIGQTRSECPKIAKISFSSIYKLGFEIFMIFGHSDTVLSI